MSEIANLIEEGDGQIVLIPTEFAFSCEAVSIRRDGDAVILEPLKDDQSESAPFHS
ncbi:MAG: hypothetical protein Q8M32_11705 [Brevundimonas sp.]|nr:hypothetical protein [Brevundimonas sp.]